jgi:hypothetical protein
MAKKKLRTYRDVARRYNNCSIRTIEKWALHPEWPERNKDGSYSLGRIDRFLKLYGLGPYNLVRSEKGRQQRSDFYEARRAYLAERVANLIITNQRLAAELRQLAGTIILAKDAAAFGERMRAASLKSVDAAIAELKSLIEPLPPDAKEKLIEILVTVRSECNVLCRGAIKHLAGQGQVA